MMRRALISAGLCVVLMLQPSQARDTARTLALPLDNARVFTRDQELLLRWPANPKDQDRVDLWGLNLPSVSRFALGGSCKVPVLPGALYTWRVQRISPQGGVEVVPPRRFSLVTADYELHFDGANGQKGRGTSDGADGEDGQRVVLEISDLGEYKQLKVLAPTTESVLIAPDAPPLMISACGGRGGAGANGQDGYAGTTYLTSTTSGVPMYRFQDGGPGDPGTRGGRGGKGGSIAVHTDGQVDVGRYLQLRVRGGKGGPGGRGGRGGFAASPPPIPNALVIGNPQRGLDGADGANGEAGGDGSVSIR